SSPGPHRTSTPGAEATPTPPCARCRTARTPSPRPGASSSPDDLAGPSAGFQRGDALDVMRHREQVERADVDQPPAAITVVADVPGQRRRVAGDVRRPPGVDPAEQVDDLLAGAAAWRVEYHQVGAAQAHPAQLA